MRALLRCLVQREERRGALHPLDQPRARAEREHGIVARAQRGVRARPPVGAQRAVDDAEELHDPLVEVEIVATLQEVGVLAAVRPDQAQLLRLRLCRQHGDRIAQAIERHAAALVTSDPVVLGLRRRDAGCEAGHRHRRRAEPCEARRDQVETEARRAQRGAELALQCCERRPALGEVGGERLAEDRDRPPKLAERAAREGVLVRRGGRRRERGSVCLELGEHGAHHRRVLLAQDPPLLVGGQLVVRADARRLVVERLHARVRVGLQRLQPGGEVLLGEQRHATQLADHRIELCVERGDAAAPLRRERPADRTHLALPLVAVVVVVVVALLAVVRRAAAAPVAAAARAAGGSVAVVVGAAADDRGIEDELR